LTLSGSGNITATGNTLNNRLTGNAGINSLNGGVGNDILVGGAGADTLIGGAGKDDMTGGLNNDRFDFNAISESVVGANRDVIRDFNRAQADRIDLITIDARSNVAGDQAFTFIAGSAFSGTSGQLRFAGGILSGDINGDKIADFEIQLVGVTALSATDFLL